MIKNVTIIGVGSLGGFFADNISKLPGLELLVIIDHDIVELRNVKNSIYQPKDVGRKKVDALKDILQPATSANILEVDKEFKEGRGDIKTIPPCDFVFDCRDIICKRGRLIDARFYISLRSLIIDCRKDTKVKDEKKGRYVEYMTKSDVMHAASQAFQIVSSGAIYSLMENQLTHSIDLDVPMLNASKCVLATENKPDMLYDYIPGEEKISNLHDTITQICQQRQNSDIHVYVGSQKIKSSEHVLPQVKDLVDTSCYNPHNIIISTMQDISKIVDTAIVPYENYVIKFVTDGNPPYIELLPDTGGA